MAKQKKMVQTKSDEQNSLVIVGIGASAGGLEALQAFFTNMPEKSGLAFVVIQHLSPDYKSLMDELLARYTRIRIRKIEDGDVVESDHIYLIPPRKNMKIFDGRLLLEEQDSTKVPNLPIDIFFRSLAKEKGKNAVGIILSGTGSDGALGVRAIKEAGGMVMVQDNDSAKFDGMPRSSVATGVADYILPPHRMPEELLNFVEHPIIAKPKDIRLLNEEEPDIISKILLVLRESSGIDFSYYKENTILRRLERRVSINRLFSFEQYFDFLKKSEKEKEIIFRELLIGVTRFFRDGGVFEALNSKVIVNLFSFNNTNPLRIWVVGCSTGEEAYSIGILLLEFIERQNIKREIKIFATDIDRNAIEIASTGFYPDNIVSDIDTRLISKYFVRREGGYQVSETLRKMIIFAVHNVLNDPPFSKIDLISCRNLFIYFKSEIQTKVLSMFYFALNPNGYMLMGSSESIGDMESAFDTVDAKHKLFKYKEGYKAQIPNRDMPMIKQLPPEKSYATSNTMYNPLIQSQRQERLLDALLEKFVPPAIIIDSQYHVVRLINDVNRYLRFPQGSFSQEVFALLPEVLQPLVRSMLRRLRNTNDNVLYENIKFDDDKGIVISIEGRLIYASKSANPFYLLIFTETIKTKATKPGKTQAIDIGDQYQERLGDLEKELQYTKESLQATVEELETSNEELQSSNEELIASNEELQSTNEELQSVNEELYTVNSEYQKKIEELTQLNNDVNNLLRNTNIGTLYLDRKLCIRKFTPIVSVITNILESDIGRPIHHIDTSAMYKDFNAEIAKVAETLQTIEREIIDAAGNSYLLKIMPYRTEDYAIDGIIITFVNINSLNAARSKAVSIEKKLVLAMEMGQMAWWEWDLPSGLVTFEDKKATMLGYTVNEFPKNVYKVTELIHPDDYEMAMKAMRDYLSGKVLMYDVTYRIRTKSGGYHWYYDRGGITEYDKDGKPLKLTGIVIDMTNQKGFEAEIRRQRDFLYKILENSPLAKTLVDASGKITYTNKRAQFLFNISKEEIQSRTFDDSKWEITDLDGKPISADQLPFAIIKKSKKDLFGYRHFIKIPNKAKQLLQINGSPMLSGNGDVEGVVFSIEVLDL